MALSDLPEMEQKMITRLIDYALYEDWIINVIDPQQMISNDEGSCRMTFKAIAVSDKHSEKISKIIAEGNYKQAVGRDAVEELIAEDAEGARDYTYIALRTFGGEDKDDHNYWQPIGILRLVHTHATERKDDLPDPEKTSILELICDFKYDADAIDELIAYITQDEPNRMI